MQQQIVQAGIVAVQMIGEPGIVFQPIGLGEIGQQGARDGEAPGVVIAAGEHFERVLGGIDAGSAICAVDHQAHAAVVGEDSGERAQPGRRIGEMMEHAAAVDIVEGAETEIEIGEIEQGADHETDVAELTRLGARLGDVGRGLRQVEMNDFADPTGVAELLRQHDRPVAGTAAGDQRAERWRAGAEPPRPGEQIVIDLGQVTRRAGDQTFGFVRRVARGVRIALVLGVDRVVPAHRITLGPWSAPPCRSICARSSAGTRRPPARAAAGAKCAA